MTKPLNSMSVKDAIFGRRSVRAYDAEPIGTAALHALLDAAVRAPTAMHTEPWQFAIVQDGQLLQRISDLAKSSFVTEAARMHAPKAALNLFTQPSFNVFYDAPCLVVICARSTGQFAVADCWLAAQNLMLAAHAMGLGSCVIGAATTALNTAEVKDQLGIPAGTEAVAPIIVGKPRGESHPSARHDPQVLAWR